MASALRATSLPGIRPRPHQSSHPLRRPPRSGARSRFPRPTLAIFSRSASTLSAMAAGFMLAVKASFRARVSARRTRGELAFLRSSCGHRRQCVAHQLREEIGLSYLAPRRALTLRSPHARSPSRPGTGLGRRGGGAPLPRMRSTARPTLSFGPNRRRPGRHHLADLQCHTLLFAFGNGITGGGSVPDGCFCPARTTPRARAPFVPPRALRQR